LAKVYLIIFEQLTQHDILGSCIKWSCCFRD